MVCPGMAAWRSLMVLFRLHRRGVASRQDDVPPVARGPFVLGKIVVIVRDQAIARLLISDRLVDRVEREQRITREVHLGDHPLGEIGSEQREVDMRRAPRVEVVFPRVGTRLYRRERVVAILIGQATPDAGEVWIYGRWVLITLVDVPPCRVGLPDLYQ